MHGPLNVKFTTVLEILFTANVLKFQVESLNTNYAIFCMKKLASLCVLTCF
jgi:hypothetical protein